MQPLLTAHPWLGRPYADRAQRRARAVAAGHTNTQVAERLYVAPSTVKTHLERIYAKLGISGRWSVLGDGSSPATKSVPG